MNVLSNNRLKALAAYRQQKNCEAEGVFVVEGIKMAAEALRSGWKIRTICATTEAFQALGNVDDVELLEAKPEHIERLSSLRSPQGVWMLVERRTENGHTPSPLVPRGTPPNLGGESVTESFNGERRTENGELVLALDGLQDPGNMGTILRTCDWFGVREVLCSKDTVSCYNPKVVQATMGAIFRTRVEYCDLVKKISALSGEGYTVFGAMLDGENVFKLKTENGHTPSPLVPRGTPPNLGGETATKSSNGESKSVLVIGNEGHGISPVVADVVERRLTIPNIGGTCESLNASVAAGILISEFCR